MAVRSESFDRERAIFPEAVLAFIRGTQPTEWAKLEALHAEKTGEQVLAGKATEQTIALLKERRAALIAAAVSGQIDVGAAV